VSKRTPGQVYATLTQAGFSPPQATVMTAIAGAESGYDPANLGDVRLEDSTWGPSFGLFQVRTSKAQTGTGGDRDITRLASSDLEQARAAYEISGHGTNFTPWSVYNSGRYQTFLPAAQQAAGDGGAFPTFGPDWLPWNWGADAGNAVSGGVDQAVTGVRNLGVQVVFVVLGVALLGGGVAVALRPQITTAANWVTEKRRAAGRVVLAAAK